jgi:CitMHS family citrate-Mg2+:H+ or citrate-Ca2+:H+ symporter
MLTCLGFAMVLTFLFLIMSKRLTALIAITLVPIFYAVLAWGLGALEGGKTFPALGHIKLAALGPMMLEGIRTLAPTGVLLMFAILYFALMIDAGLFDPMVRWILRLVKGDPLKVAMGTVLLTLLVSLDGDGSTTYMICVAALYPLFKRLGMNPLIMTCLMLLSSGVMNLTPWGGPTARAASALHVDTAAIFVPMIPSMLISIAWLFVLAYLYGRYERRRLGVIDIANSTEVEEPEDAQEGAKQEIDLRRPKLRWFNGLLTVALMTALVFNLLPLPVLFMIAFGIAIIVNYPDVTLQRQRIGAHSETVLAVVSLIFAAGIFTGILSGTGMVEAMSKSLLAIIPAQLGPHLAVITALVSMPFTFFISNDAFYFGVLPILSEAASHYGITPVEMARASVIGQPVHLLSPLVPSTYLLTGLAKVEFGDHQRFTLKWALITSFVLLISALLLGAFPIQK